MNSAPPEARRIALLHGLRESIEPIRDAFERVWPQAATFNVLDDSLSESVRREGGLTPAVIERVGALAMYAAGIETAGRRAEAILFTGSAFGRALELTRPRLRIPLLSPTEAAFDRALAVGGRLVVLVSFEPSLEPLLAEAATLAAQRRVALDLHGIFVNGALEALQRGDAETHDALIFEAIRAHASGATVMLGQFSMARAAASVPATLMHRVLTTPDCAVERLRLMLEAST